MEKKKTLKETERVATLNAEGEGETRGSRLQNFISSLFASIGGVFAPFQEEPDMDIASKVVLPQQHQLKGIPFFAESFTKLHSIFFGFWFSQLGFLRNVYLGFIYTVLYLILQAFGWIFFN